MLRHLLLLPAVFLLISCSDDSTSQHLSCLAWEIYQERLKLICRIPGFSHPVSLFDSKGQLYVQCTFDRNVHNCTPAFRNDSVVTNFALNYITVTTEMLNNEMNGLWVCLQNNIRLTTYVNLSKGIRDSTKVSITGLFRNEKDNLRSIIRCSSCREPDGYNVEFLENKQSVDSLSFSNETGICTHKYGKCQLNKCSCTGLDFILVFQNVTKTNGSVYSCDVLYTDSYTQEKFSIHASTFFNGKDFYMTKTYSEIIKAGDKIWNGPFVTTLDIQSDIENDPASTTPASDEENISLVTIGGLQTIHVIAIVIGCVMVFIVALLFFLLYFQRKSSNEKTTHEITDIELSIESEPLIETENKSSIEIKASTGETKIHRSTMTETSYLLQEKSVYKQNLSSYVRYYFCDPCSYQFLNRSALFFCIDCEEALCAICSHYHNVMKQTRKHNCVSMNKVPINFSLPLTCTDHDSSKYEYYCVDDGRLCCIKCITTCHQECKLESIDDSSNGFQKTQVFYDYDRQLNKYIDLLVNLSTNQYYMIDQMTKFENEMDCENVKDKLEAYAKETCEKLVSTREQKALFEFMKTYGSDKHLFILTHFLKKSLIEIDQRVSVLVGHTKNACTYKTKSQENNVATFPTIEKIETELENIFVHRWRQSQTPVK